MAFYWECEALRLAVAPWRSDPRRQHTVRARAAVAEQRTPGFALRFDLEVLEEEEAEGLGGCRLMRLVGQRQMLRAFEFAFVGAGTEKRRPPGGDEGGSELLDVQLKKWLAGGGHVPAPPKEELARWLLAWMVLTPAAAGDGDKQPDEWLVLMCAEAAVEEDEEDFADHESGDASDPVFDGGKDNEESEEHCDEGSGEETEDDDDLPPPYEQVEAAASEFPSPGERNPGKGIKQQQDERRLSESKRAGNARQTLQTQAQSAKEQSKRGSSIRSSSGRSLASTRSSSTLLEQKSELKASIVRLNPRLDSLDAVTLEEPSNEWSEDRRHCHQELRASRRDVQTAKQQRDQAGKLAHLRHTQLLKESARKLRANEQKRRDADAVRQLVADTLEYRDELCAMESSVKQASIAAHRDQERVKRQMRVVLGNTEKASRGTLHRGPGPLSKKEIFGDSRDDSAVYDLHGRRHNLEKAGLVAKESALESAMRKVRRLVLSSGKSVDKFRRYDLDRTGTLSYSEFQRMLRENGTGNSAELTQEQSMVFFKRFDTDKSGEVDYGELLWAFLNWEAFLKRWHERKHAPTDREVRQSFKRYDPTSRGVLPLKEFQLVLDRLGVTLGDVDAELLSVKFDAGKDGYIDYHNFLDFVNLSDFQDDTSTASAKHSSQSTAQTDLRTSTAPPGMERIWMELQEISTTQEKLQRLLRK
ncbi:hypothetical protein PHYPSEUDO_003770 [Phytophthora pseudosyringae]|uniref:EF-hand domain-containing protein n=1 Tax=Phytophthora pseudosyringae TaxID=221518 RepID=A0A8T1WE69_9STRA|nr:hypothetical protein PHYPSEUDO_003770 [Phytophthora pseudosyringae]